MYRLYNAGKRKKYLAFAVMAAAGYLLFLTSALWLPEQEKALEYTQPGIQTEIGESTSTATLISWEYAKEEAAMSVEIDFSGLADGSASFAAIDKEREKLPVSVVLWQSGTCVLKISKIPEDFAAVSLRITVGEDTVRLYTNINQVDCVEALSFYGDLQGYYQARIRRNIRDLEEQIDAAYDRIAAYEEEITGIREQIAQAQERMPYLSKQQRDDTLASIDLWEKQITEDQEKQEVLQDEITELTEEKSSRQKLLSGQDADGNRTDPETESVSDPDTENQEETN